MNKKLQEALAELINITIQGKDFIIEQAPDVIQQLLAWKFTMSLIGFSAGAVLFVISLPIFLYHINKFDRNKYSDHSYNEQDKHIIYCIVSAIAGVASLFIIFFNLAWLQIWIAPKVYLLEYASHLIK